MTITGRQIREARVLLKWDRSKLARRLALPLTVIERAERGDGEPHITTAQVVAIRGAFSAAGVDFTADPPSVRLRAPSPADPDEA